MNMVWLDPLELTGNIDENTPECVLQEMCSSLSIKYKHDIEYIIESVSRKKKAVHFPIKKDIDSLRIIARFINDSLNWNYKSLVSAFQFYREMENRDNRNSTQKKIKNMKIGRQTPEDPFLLNSRILYRLCRDNDIKLSFKDGNSDMFSYLILFNNLESHVLKQFAKAKILDFLKYDASSSNLINILNTIDDKSFYDYVCQNEKKNNEEKNNEEKNNEEKNNEEKNGEICKENKENYTENREELIKVFTEMERLNDETLRKYTPRNRNEAIVLAAKNFNLDISFCKSPLIEYNLMMEETYFPFDEEIKRRLKLNKFYNQNIHNPYINKNFNPSFPSFVYSYKDLKVLCVDENIEIDIDDNSIHKDILYSVLESSYCTDNFMHGKEGKIVNKTNTFLENFEDLDFDEVLIFGKRYINNSIGPIKNIKFKGYTYAELADTFSKYKQFIDPQTNSIFTDSQIKKLYKLCTYEKRVEEKAPAFIERCRLKDEIDRVKIYLDSENIYIKKLVELHESKDYKNYKVKNLIYEFFKCLLDSGMYMRGWDGVKPYPLKSMNTTFDVEKEQANVDSRVTQSLSKLDSILEKMDGTVDNLDLRNYIKDLPLMKYNKESQKFISCTDLSEGLTIYDRVKIIKGGSDIDNPNSCIRLSSNRICATAYYYMFLLKYKLSFPVSDIDEIA